MALLLSVIAVLSVAAADILHYASKKDGVLTRMVANMRTQVALVGGHSDHDQMLRGEIDYAPTGAIIGLRRAAPLSPCTGEQK